MDEKPEKLDTPCTFQDGAIECHDTTTLEMDGVVLLEKGVLTEEGRRVVDKPKPWWRR